MKNRRRAREVAFQLLYELELNPDVPEERRRRYAQENLPDPALRHYALTLVDGVRTKQKHLDELISRFSQRWPLYRIGAVERVAMRIGLFEMLFQPDVPAAVAISEAVELAKRYGDPDSYRFVNGILDNARRELLSPQAPSSAPSGGESVAEETV